MLGQKLFKFKVRGYEVLIEDEEAKRREDQLRLGDGGQIKHRLANAALQRRGDLKRVEEELRIYDHGARKEWERKYAHFSGKHMRNAGYKQFAQAQHDPFNKSPAWGKKILHMLGQACERNKITPQELFEAADVGHDRKLTREEMRRLFLAVKNDLSDGELTVMFDAIDASRQGEVSADDFCRAVEDAKRGQFGQVDVHRNPVAQFPRLPPRRDDVSAYLLEDQEILDQDNVPLDEIENRIQKVVDRSWLRRQRKESNKEKVSKYHFFPSATQGRFMRAVKRRSRMVHEQVPIDFDGHPRLASR